MKKIAIMQPTYLPWLGYFAMIERADVFVFLDSVQFARRSWQQRNRIKGPQGEMLLSLPVIKKGLREQKICDVRLDHSANILNNHCKSIKHSYKKTDFFSEYAPALFSIYEKNHEKLCDLNIDLIMFSAQELGLSCEFSRSSDLKAEGQKADLLANICEELSADVYVSALGSKNYLDETDVFERKNIQIEYNHYAHPVYQQLFGEFLPSMGVIDLLFNEGPKSRDILLSGIKKNHV